MTDLWTAVTSMLPCASAHPRTVILPPYSATFAACLLYLIRYLCLLVPNASIALSCMHLYEGFYLIHVLFATSTIWLCSYCYISLVTQTCTYTHVHMYTYTRTRACTLPQHCALISYKICRCRYIRICIISVYCMHVLCPILCSVSNCCFE